MRIFTTLIFTFLSICGFSQTETILDFETEATSTLFYYFGSDLQDMPNNIIDNPDASGINTSATVADFTHPNNGELWAGAYAQSCDPNKYQ